MNDSTDPKNPECGSSRASSNTASVATIGCALGSGHQAASPMAVTVLSSPTLGAPAPHKAPEIVCPVLTTSMTGAEGTSGHGDRVKKGDAPPELGRGYGGADSSVQEELTKTAVARHPFAAASGSVFAGVKGVTSLVSFPLPELDHEQQKGCAVNEPIPLLNPDRNAPRPYTLLHGDSAETACTPRSGSTVKTTAVEQPASLTSPESGPDPVQSTAVPCKNKELVAAPVSQRPKTRKTFVIPVSRGSRRGRHLQRPPHPTSRRSDLQTSFRAQAGHREPTKKQTSPVPQERDPPAPIAIPTPRPRPDTSCTQAPQINPAEPADEPALPLAIPVVGKIETAAGRLGSSLLVKQARKENPSAPHNTFQIDIRDFRRFPPPDMHKANREFDRELEECRVIHKGFDQAHVEALVARDAEGTAAFTKTMEQHHQERESLQNSVSAMKKKLAELSSDREYAMRALSGGDLPVRTQRQLNDLLRKIDEDEANVTRALKKAEQELEEAAFRGRRKLARALRYDFSPAAAVDDMQTAALLRHTVRQEAEELGIAAAMIGLRGSKNQQDAKTRQAIERSSQYFVDKALKALDQPDKTERSTTPTLELKLDSVVTAVPEWFTILDGKGTINLQAANPRDRYKELIQAFGKLAVSAENEKSAPEKPVWDKEFHQPDPAWPHEKQRRKGGWWRCRSGADAPPAERNCKLCHRKSATPSRRQSPPARNTAESAYKHMLGEIETAMAEANKRDQLALKYQLQQEQNDLDRYWQQREAQRCGGDAHVCEMLYDRGVNGLNYRPSAGPSRPSSSAGPVTTRHQDTLGDEHVNDRSPGPTTFPPNLLRVGHALLSEQLAGVESPEPPEYPQLPRRHSSFQPSEDRHDNESDGGDVAAEAGQPQLRPSLVRPGQPSKRKSVSWLL